MIYSLNTTPVPDIAQVGGKGLSLIKMSAANLPVPHGFVLATVAYEAFVEEQGLRQRIVDLEAAHPSGDAAACESTSAAIYGLFRAAEIPERIQAGLLAAYADLARDGDGGERLAVPFTGEPEVGSRKQLAQPVAVRSSATAEDSPDASFAGQHDSLLNVQGQEALLDAVVRCWASLWTARAIAYRKRQGIDAAAVSMAVVVQQLVPAEAAGILFTANPVDGTRQQAVINATWGLGEAIVGGRVTPDTLVVDTTTWEVLSRETASKSVMTALAPAGTEERRVPVGQRDRPVLDDATAVDLARTGMLIEDHFGRPMDVEWAVSGGEIAVLQARPITRLPPAPLADVRWDPPQPGTIWMRRQIVEHMPEPLSPLFDELYLRAGLDRSMDSMAGFLGDLSGIEINVWDFLDPPFAATVNGYAYSRASFKFSLGIIPVVLRMYVSVLPKMIRYLIPRWEEESLPNYLATIEAWNGIDLDQAHDGELLQGVRALAAEDAIYWFAAAIPLGKTRTADAALDRFLRWVTAGRLTSGSYLRGFPSKAVEAQIQLEAIARRIDAFPVLRRLVLETPAPRLVQALEAQPEAKPVLDDLQRYLDDYGHQIYNLDFAAPTLSDDPLPVLLSLKTAAAHPERDASTHQAEMALQRDLLVANTARVLNPVQRRVFRQLLSWAERFVPNREDALFYVGAAWPALRRLALELGRRLADAGSLDAPGHVFYLESAELASAIAARAAGTSRPDLAGLARQRLILREARKRLEPPVVVPPGGRMKFGPVDMGAFEPKARSASTGPRLEGFAVSPGQVTAPASLIRSPEDFGRMAPDSILVCPTTTPAWTPLFGQAAGLVTDIGGALAHGSIVAREYGIPAVMGTGVATQRIKSGQLIRVDGDRGTVMLVDEIDPEEEARNEALRAAKQRAASRKRRVLLVLAAGGSVALAVWWKGCRNRPDY